MKLKHYWQSDNSSYCGCCCVLSILDYYGIKKPNGRKYTIPSLVKLLKVDKNTGVPQSVMISFLVSVGLTTKLITFEEIGPALKNEHPIIALIKEESGTGHYTLMEEMVDNPEDVYYPQVICQDSAFGPNLARDLRVLHEQVKYGNNWLLEVWK